MMFSREAFIHDAELEIIVPNDILDCNEEKIDYIIGAKQRTQIFYDELLHCYLISTLPPESNLENKEEATDFFKNLEITLEATLINTNLAVSSDYYSSQLVHRAPSSSSTTSSISGIFSSGRASIRSRSSSNSTSSTSPTLPGSPASDYNFKKFSVGKFTEGSVIYSVQYNSKSKNYDKMVVVKKDGRWICVLPLSFPVAYIRTRAHGQVTLSVNVTQPQRYSVEYFGMNLLEGLNDDPAFESLNTVCSIPSSRFTKQDPIKRVTSLASTHKILSVKPTLNVRIKITNVSSSENTLMMSVELENDTEHAITFSIEDVKIEVAHAFVTRYGWSLDTSNDKFPILLQPVDQVTLLYNVTILEDSSFPKSWNTQQRYPTPISHSEASSRRGSIASINPILNTLPIENKHRILSIIVKACPIIDGIKLRHIESRRNCMLDISTLLTNSTTAAHNPFNLNNIKSLHNIGLGNKNEMDGDNGILPSGRLPKLQKQTHLDVCGGVAVSFIVCGKPVVGRVFTIKVFMVNQSDQVRRFTIMIPNKKKLDERLLQLQSSPSTLLSQTTDITLIESNNINSNVENVENVENVKQPLRNPFMDETEFLRKHLEFEITDANLICLDDEVKVCSIDPYKSESTTLHFVSTKVALQAVELVQLVDIDTGFITNLRNVVQVDVKRNAKNQKIIGHNSVVLRHIEVTG